MSTLFGSAAIESCVSLFKSLHNERFSFHGFVDDKAIIEAI